jgi:hypothetical protein
LSCATPESDEPRRSAFRRTAISLKRRVLVMPCISAGGGGEAGGQPESWRGSRKCGRDSDQTRRHSRFLTLRGPRDTLSAGRTSGARNALRSLEFFPLSEPTDEPCAHLRLRPSRPKRRPTR